MKNAKQRIIIGGVLIALQLFAVMGNALAGEMPSFDNFAILLGYFSFGIIGVVLLVQGMRMLPKDGSDNTKDDSNNDSNNDNKEE
jgi:hypothetical protein